MLVIGNFRPRPEAYVQKYTEKVDITPWKYLRVSGIAICLIVLGIYIYFAG
jgi:SSS family solute:Na+ symporter